MVSGCAGRFKSAAAGGTSNPNSAVLIPNGTPISYLITPICFRAPPAGHPTMTEWPRSAPQGRQSAARGTRCGERGRMVCAPTGSRLPFGFMLLPPRRERRVLGGEGGGTTVVIYQAGNIPVLCLSKATQINTAQRQCIELKKGIEIFRPDMIVISEETFLQCDCFYIGEMDRFQLAQQIADVLIVFFHLLPGQLNNVRGILCQF